MLDQCTRDRPAGDHNLETVPKTRRAVDPAAGAAYAHTVIRTSPGGEERAPTAAAPTGAAVAITPPKVDAGRSRFHPALSKPAKKSRGRRTRAASVIDPDNEG